MNSGLNLNLNLLNQVQEVLGSGSPIHWTEPDSQGSGSAKKCPNPNWTGLWPVYHTNNMAIKGLWPACIFYYILSGGWTNYLQKLASASECHLMSELAVTEGYKLGAINGEGPSMHKIGIDIRFHCPTYLIHAHC